MCLVASYKWELGKKYWPYQMPQTPGFTPRKYWLITQEAVAPSRHDWKIVDWDVKPQHKQTDSGIWSGFALFANRMSYKKWICNEKVHQTPHFSFEGCLMGQLIRMENSTYRVRTDQNRNFYLDLSIQAQGIEYYRKGFLYITKSLHFWAQVLSLLRQLKVFIDLY